MIISSKAVGEKLISVIIPVYNAEKYIENCVSSILTQTYRNFELILVNDGSTDQSLKLCEELAARDSRIKVIDRENGGAGAARNSGLKVMKGEYVVFADSDDYVSESYLENLYLAAESGGFDIVQCNLQSSFQQGKKSGSVEYNQSDVSEITKVQALNYRLYKVSICSKIYSSHLFMDFEFREGIIYEDDASYYIFIDKAERIAILNETLYYYFMSDNSVMRNNKKDKSTEFIDIYEERLQYFKNKNDVALIEGTYDRYCLVLMLVYSNAVAYGNNQNDMAQFMSLFKKYYPEAMRAKEVSMKDKLMFSCFRLCPSFTGKMIARLRK